MKSFFTLVFLAGSISIFAQTTIPNAGFENWTTQGAYENPDSWDSPNEISSSLEIAVAEAETSIVYEGTYSAKISVKSSIGGPLPGVLTLGDFEFSFVTMEATIDGGTPFTGRPDRFTGYFQYEPQNNDECFFGAMLLKENGSNFDTIATAGFYSDQTLLTWTKFDTTFEYRSTETPTHLNIILMPSDQNNPQVNSVVYVDALELTYASNISDYSVSTTNVFINESKLHFSELSNNEKNIRIFDINGRMVLENNQTENSISVSGLDQGMYIVRIQNNEGVFSAKFIR